MTSFFRTSAPQKSSPAKNRPFFQLWQLIVLVLLVLFAYLLANGGTLFPSTKRPTTILTPEIDQEANLNLAMNALFSQREFGTSGVRVISYLNQWAELGGTKINWKRDALGDKLPPYLSKERDDIFRSLEDPSFSSDDIRHLRETLMLRACATWISTQAVPEPYAPWLNEVEKTAGAEGKEQLAVALKLFDWTIRNIQLEALLPPPPAPISVAGDNPLARVAAIRGIPGPGYTRTPTQIMLHSQGDSWQRMRLFLLLARQAGIPGTVLSIQTGDSIWDTKPWAAGILVEKKIYLFDAELGLPLPGATDGSIATLEEVLADPGLLRKLDLPGIGTYPIVAADLEKIIALVDGTPQSFSQRMIALQQALTGDRKLVLTAPLSELREGLWKSPGIKQVLLWSVPFESMMYAQNLQNALLQDPARLEDYVRRYGMFEGRTALSQARLLHLEGIFDSVDQKLGARDRYLQSRPPDRDLRLMVASETMRAQFGIEQQLPKKEPEREAAIDRIAAILQHTKEFATFSLGIVHYEQGKYQLAEEWFRERIIDGAADSPWVPAARYNLGRSYEALGEWQKARDQYVADQSPQRYGNVLRATWIKKRQAAQQDK